MRLNKYLFILLISALLILSLAACGQKASPVSPTVEPSDELNEISKDRIFTLQELSSYNGENGNPAYIAVDGIVYDVSDIDSWKNGSHNGFKAGADLTVEINEQAPHGTSTLENLPIVGKLESN